MGKGIKSKLALALTALLLISTIVACSDNSSKPDTGNENNTAVDETTVTETTLLYPELDPQDFGGVEFRVLTQPRELWADWEDWGHRDISAVEPNGDIINDAVYARNLKIEEKYNVKVTEYKNDGFDSVVKNTVMAGDNAYELICPPTLTLVSFAQNGYLYNLFNVPYIDLSMPWYDQSAVRDLVVGDYLYGITGDLILLDNDATTAMIFNKQVLEDYSLGSPYDYVNNGQWTMDKLIEMTQAISEDLNGDGELYILDDKFGTIVQDDAFYSFLAGTGERIVSTDAEGYPYISFGSDKTYAALDKIITLMYDKDHVVNLHTYGGKFLIYQWQTEMFSLNRVLFSWIRMRVVETLRNMETDFGILPVPKYDEAQKEYFSLVNPYTSTTFAIPISNPNIEMAGMIIEDLSAESMYTLSPAYYDLNLGTKFIRDNESSEMLDIIFKSTLYEIGEIYAFGGFAGTILRYPSTYKNEFASSFARVEERMQTDIDKMISNYQTLEELNAQ
jgi:ABC-type sugar transport system, periplasmic component